MLYETNRTSCFVCRFADERNFSVEFFPLLFCDCVTVDVISGVFANIQRRIDDSNIEKLIRFCWCACLFVCAVLVRVFTRS